MTKTQTRSTTWRDPVGIVEIAERLEVRRQTVDQWRYRFGDGFPIPRGVIGGRPAWEWPTVLAWAKATGRA